MTPPRSLDQGKWSKQGQNHIFTYTPIGFDGKRMSRRPVNLGPNRRIAEARAKQLIDERNDRLHGLGPDTRPQRPWREWIAPWQASYADDVGELKARNAVSRVTRVLEGINATTFAQITLGDVELFLDGLRKSSAASTVNSYVASLRVFLKWCAGREVIPADNAIRPQYRSTKDALKRPELTDEQVAAIFKAGWARDARTRETWGSRGIGGIGPVKYAEPFPRMHTIEFLVLTINRVGAARQVRWADVHRAPDKRYIHFRATTMKRRNDVFVPIAGDLARLLDDIQATHVAITGREPHSNEPVLRTPSGRAWTRCTHPLVDWFQAVLADAGIPKSVPGFKDIDVHCLRGYGATRMLRQGCDPILVAKIGGWTSPAVMLKHYEKLNLDDTRKVIAAMGLPTGNSEQIGPGAHPAWRGGGRDPPKSLRRFGFRRRAHVRPRGAHGETLSSRPPRCT